MHDISAKQFVIYSRKSKFTGKGESIENQIELCRQYIASHYSAAEADSALIYEDEGYSGGTLDRPQFKKMMKDSKSHNFFAIVVYRLDRISRNIGDFANLIEDLGNRNIAFISIREQFDTSSPMGRAMMYIASVFSQLERETIAERIRDNMRELAKTGRWLGGVTPTGYESESVSRVTVDGKVKKACKLKIIPEEIESVKTIFAKFIETGSLTKVDQFLLEKRIVTKKGNRFTRFTIKAILSNPVYMIADDAAYNYLNENHVDLFAERDDFDGVHGIMAYNRTHQKPGKTHQIKPMEEWIVSVGGHDGIIPGETWVSVQSKLELNKSKSYRRPRSNAALLSGILYCASCGDYMRPKLSDRVNAKGEIIYSYLCSTKERSRSKCCTMKNPNGNLLDEKITEEIKKTGISSSDYIKQIQQAKKLLDAERDDYDTEISNISKEIEEREEAIQSLIEALAKAKDTSAEKYILDEIDKSHEKLEVLRSRLSELEAVNSRHVLSDMEFDMIRQMLSDFGSVVDNMNVEQKRSAIRTFVKRAVWDGENVHLFFFNSDEDFIFPDKTSGRDPVITDESGKPSGEDSE
ncbi:MAG: recombinase family protein [Eubacteriales bacterium]